MSDLQTPVKIQQFIVIEKEKQQEKKFSTVIRHESKLNLKTYDNTSSIKMKGYSSGKGLGNIKMREIKIGSDFNRSINNGFIIYVEKKLIHIRL